MGHPTHIFVDQPVDENLICSICLDVCCNATTACSAGHTFCESCLGRLKKKECPACRSDYQTNVPNRPLRSMICALRVRCCVVLLDDDNGGLSDRKKRRTGGGSGDNTKGDSNPDDSCSWEGALGDLNNHNKVCAFVKMRCPLRCGKRFRRMDVKKHEEECTHRKVECKMCNDKITQSGLKNHQASYCPKAQVKCNYCGEEMDRESLGKKGNYPLEYFPDTIRKMDRDRANINMCTGHYLKCPKLILRCEFYKRGCKGTFTRDTAAVHHAENVQYHAALVDRTCSRLYDELDYDFVAITWPIHIYKLWRGA